MMSPRHKEPDNDEVTTAELSSPGGWKARLEGLSASGIGVAFLFISGVVLLIWQFDQHRRDREKDTASFLQQHKITHELLTTVTSNQAVIMTEIRKASEASASQAETVVYVLALDQKKRESLNLAMPPALRKQVGNGNR
jgi:hypothetical protein